jgi:hypothetical protein
MLYLQSGNGQGMNSETRFGGYMKIPKWIWVWCLLMGLLPLGFVCVAYVNPSFYGEEWVTGGVSRLGGVYGNYVSRNMASALIMFFALSQRSAQMLIVALLMRIFSDVFDVIHNTVAGTIDGQYIFEASVFVVGSLVAIYYLRGLRKTRA